MDQAHSTINCPWYRKPDGTARARSCHPDAIPLPQDERPPLLPDAPPVIATGTVEVQPADGSCLYHSLGRGALPRVSAAMLRPELAAFMAENPKLLVNGKTMTEWLSAERGAISMDEYTRRQARFGWGGSIEILSYMLKKKTNVWVWVPLAAGKYRLTTRFDLPANRRRQNLCYKGGAHYDWIHLDENEVASGLRRESRAVMPAAEQACAVV